MSAFARLQTFGCVLASRMSGSYEWYPRAPSKFENVAWIATLTVSGAVAFCMSADVRAIDKYGWIILLVNVCLQQLLLWRGPKLRHR